MNLEWNLFLTTLCLLVYLCFSVLSHRFFKILSILTVVAILILNYTNFLAIFCLVFMTLEALAGLKNKSSVNFSSKTGLFVYYSGYVAAVMLSVLSLDLPSFYAYTAAGLIVFGVSVVNIVSSIKNISRFRLDSNTSTPEHLPTVSILVPARNEDKALTDCLESMVQTDYPKLEIIVVDDCSSDKTPDIIRHFAQKGVRFVPGNEPSVDWVGKNNAMAVLAEEASGEILVFADVDVRISASSIRRLVFTMAEKDLSMVSVWPQRFETDVLASIVEPSQGRIQASKNLTLLRNLPVSGKFLMIKKSELTRIGGFAAYKNSVLPELLMSEQFQKDNKYRYYQSDPSLGITIRKKPDSNIATSVRILFPMLESRPLRVMIFAGYRWMVLIFISWSFIVGQALAALLLIVMLLIRELIATTRLTPASWFLSPIILVYDFTIDPFVAMYSMLKYQFGTVNWRGRSVCYPKYEIIKNLPKF
jgi:glycosyltransferase involved in cell wall biosynthesis